MRVNCEGCAGCCVDWRPLVDGTPNPERRGRRVPLDDAYNLVPLLRDEVRDLVDAGLGDALAPRLFEVVDPPEGATTTDETVGTDGTVGTADTTVDDTESTEDMDDTDDTTGSSRSANSVVVDGHRLAAIDGHPVFFVGLRKSPKPVGPFGTDARWLDTCTFLDPETLRCRIHGDDLYPETCAVYPGANLALDAETECERVERSFGGDRLLDATPPERTGLRLGPGAVGAKLFVHPDPVRLTGVVDRLADGSSTAADRAAFVGWAVGSRPGSTEVDEVRADPAREQALAADSWAGRVADAWERQAGSVGDRAADAVGGASHVEVDLGAPPTDEW